MKVRSFESRRCTKRRKKKKKKSHLVSWIFFFFFFLLFFHYSFCFAFWRWFLELEASLPQHFKSLKIKHKWPRCKEVFLKLEVSLPQHFTSLKTKHKWPRSKEVFHDDITIDDKQFYPEASNIKVQAMNKEWIPPKSIYEGR